MHEAAIADAILGALREQAPGRRARILVRGGHGDPEAFDMALRFHLLVGDPRIELAQMEIVHLPRVLICANCGNGYEAKDPIEACPACGGGAWPDYAPEEVELELLEKLAASAASTRKP
jgi:Zn finger protein HypA/HybF involved in hydrogenase expression